MLHCLYWLGWHSPQTRADGYCASATAFACGSFSGSGLGSSCPLADPSSASRQTMKTNPTFRIRLLLGFGQGLCSKMAPSNVGQNHIARLFSDHVNRGRDEQARNVREDRRVDDPQ